jgi:hypothetical protein
VSGGDSLFALSADPAVVAHRRAALRWSAEHPPHMVLLIEPMGFLAAGSPECSWCDCPDERHSSTSGNLTVIFTGEDVCDPALECHERATHALFFIDRGEIRSTSGSYPMLCPRHLRPAAEYNATGVRDMLCREPEVRVYGESRE